MCCGLLLVCPGSSKQLCDSTTPWHSPPFAAAAGTTTQHTQATAALCLLFMAAKLTPQVEQKSVSYSVS